MIKFLALAGLVVVCCTLMQMDLNLYLNSGSSAMALRSSIESFMFRIYTDNPANETLYPSYPGVSQDSFGAVHFIGEVTNRGGEPARLVNIIATFYDASNRVIGTGTTFTTPDTINPGQSAPYDLAVGGPYATTVPVTLIDHVKFHLGWRDSNHPF